MHIFTPLCFDPYLAGRFQNAIEATQDGHGQHDALALGRTEWATQQVCYLPDEVGELLMIGHSCLSLDNIGAIVVSNSLALQVN